MTKISTLRDLRKEIEQLRINSITDKSKIKRGFRNLKSSMSPGRILYSLFRKYWKS
jgi:hypothetical protein